MQAPILFIGGLGGSGTRAVAGAVAALGYFPGDCLNGSNDNLIFTELFKRPDWVRRGASDAAINRRLRVFEWAMRRGVNLPTLLAAPNLWRFRKRQPNGLAGKPDAIGWMTKEPNCHIFAEQILKRWPGAIFLYVTRHPLDMAFSDNKGQLGNWSWMFGLDPSIFPAPEAAQLEYWIRTQKRLDDLLARYPGRIHPLNFDNFAERPEAELEEIVKRLGLDIPSERVRNAVSEVIRPDSIGRWRSRDLTNFSAEQLAFCAKSGWPVDQRDGN
jgi:hypothetical protein